MKKMIGVIVAAACITSTANAGVITEPPDLSDNTFSPSAGPVFDVGLNTISGSINGTCVERLVIVIADCTVGDDTDATARNVPDGLTLVAATLEVSNVSFDGNLGGRGFFRVYHDAGVTDVRFFELGGASSGVFNLLPADFDTNFTAAIAIQVSSSTIVSTMEQGIGNYAFDYVISLTFENTEVPLPAALPLFIAGIAGLGFVKRRRTSAAV